jgi:hypothetical protein
MLNRVTFIPGAVLSIRGTTEQERAEAKAQDVPAPRHGGTFQKEGRIPFDPHTDFDRISERALQFAPRSFGYGDAMRPRLRRRFGSTKSTELGFCALLTSVPIRAWGKAQVWARRSSKAERRMKEFLLSSSVPESPVSVLWYSLITSWRDPGASFARSGGG